MCLILFWYGLIGICCCIKFWVLFFKFGLKGLEGREVSLEWFISFFFKKLGFVFVDKDGVFIWVVKFVIIFLVIIFWNLELKW